MRHALPAVLALALALPAAAGDIDMNLSNPAGAAPGSQSGRQTLKSLDAMLDQADAGARELEAALKAAQADLAAAAKGGAEWGAAKIAGDCRRAFKHSDAYIPAVSHVHNRTASRYFTCLALAQKSPKACALPPAQPKEKIPGRGEGAGKVCMDSYFMVRFADAVAAGSGASEICREAHAAGGGKGDAAADCAAAAALRCQRFPTLEGAWDPLEDAAHCTPIFSALKGNAAACAAVSPKAAANFGYDCKDLVAVRAARKGGDCGASPLCRALREGRVEACAPALEELAADYCRSLAREKLTNDPVDPRADIMARVRAAREPLDQHLVSIGFALDNFEPKGSEGLPARVRRFTAVRKRVDGALKRFKAATEAPAKTPAKGQGAKPAPAKPR